MKGTLLLTAALLLFLLLPACTGQDPAADPSPQETQTDGPQETKVPEEPILTLGEDGQGTWVAPVTAGGQYTALATVAFTYTTQEDGTVRVDEIGEVTMENAVGWFSVYEEADVQREKLFLSEDGRVAIVPFHYYASLGSGLRTETGAVEIDFNAMDTPAEAAG